MPIRPLIDDAGACLSDYPTLSVDLKSLADVAVALRQEVDRNLQPHITQLNSAYGTGVNFGATSQSGNMKQVRMVYHDCLVQATTLLSNCVAVGEALAVAVDEIAHRYGSSDATAAARAEDVGKTIDRAAGIGNKIADGPTASSASRTAFDG